MSKEILLEDLLDELGADPTFGQFTENIERYGLPTYDPSPIMTIFSANEQEAQPIPAGD